MSAPGGIQQSRWAIILIMVMVGFLVLGVWASPTLIKAWQRLMPVKATMEAAGETWYISQMHPWIIQKEPGQCPICGMDLTPIDPSRFAGELNIDPVTIQNIGVRSVAAENVVFQTSVRSVGIVRWDPRRVQVVESQAMGWVRDISVADVGDRIFAGAALAEIDSPDLLTAQREYLAAKDLGESTRTAVLAKLDALGLPSAERALLVEQGVVSPAIILRAPISGIVDEKTAWTGSRVGPGMPIVTLVDTSTVWVEVAIYEDQLAGISIGDAVSVEVLGGERLRGSVAYIEPEIDATSRSATLRLVIENDAGHLRSGSFVTAEIQKETSAPVLAIPRESVRRHDGRHHVFVERMRGRYEGRTVEIGGVDDQGRVAVLSGLAVGEKVVVSGQFLLDSEARVKEAIARMIGGGSTEQVSTQAVEQVAASTDAIPVQHLIPVLDATLAGHEALFRKDMTGLEHSAQSLVAAIAAWRQGDEHAHHRFPTLSDLETAAQALVKAHDIDTARVAYGMIGVALRDLVRTTGRPPGRALHLFHCGMVDVAEGGWWIQADDDLRNPYSDSMRRCGSEESW